MAKKIITLSVFFVFIVVVIFFTVFKENKTVEVFIPKGASPKKISEILKDSDIIYSKTFFIVTIKLKNCSKQLKAGLYEFNTKDGTLTIINKLINGESKELRITIPEGWTTKQIAEILNENKVCSDIEFINLAQKKNLEGYLFPNTYFLMPSMTPEEIVKIMTDEFNKFWTKDFDNRAEQMNMSKKDIIILASIVEREAVSDDERPIIAGIFLNRLSKNMRLQSCATVLYAMGINKERLTLEDLNFQSPYNTYRHSGLPPTPICNPGAKAIKAVLYPAVTDNLYFVSKGNGTHYFSSNFQDHIQNKIVSKKKETQ
ncbi:endolytic transglycosylase MltG [Candidatus Ruminimicrobium bovinum]|uniref:endolytic transglycosylase MltG n=1 Tax=Candidatus Ruminimicrobium bovinum TaxID=3242779 RepID=UPI0039B860C5